MNHYAIPWAIATTLAFDDDVGVVDRRSASRPSARTDTSSRGQAERRRQRNDTAAPAPARHRGD